MAMVICVTSSRVVHGSVRRLWVVCVDIRIRRISLRTSSELDEYLRLPTVKTIDPLVWWQNNRRTYLTLHRMALDFLSVPDISSSNHHLCSSNTYCLAQQRQPLWNASSHRRDSSFILLATDFHHRRL